MKISADALLFDSDETLLSSMKSAYRCWTRWAEECGMTIEDVLRVPVHGRPAAAIVADLLPAEKVDEALARLEQAEVDDAAAGGVVPLPGSQELLEALPADCWAVVTSGTRRVAEARLREIGVQVKHLITVDDVTQGKPDPEPFLVAAQRLGVDPGRCVVFEDAPAGLAAGRAAGMTTVALTTTHRAEELDADAVIANLSGISAHATDAGVEIAIRA
ncbi:HAD-IA family hydrolase [Streptomyces decoyicus]|uniref:HAD-IA family hydrolase n=1 Tax=Streptomyces decoyicus TaxID=249567 RepID=UPI003655827F